MRFETAFWRPASPQQPVDSSAFTCSHAPWIAGGCHCSFHQLPWAFFQTRVDENSMKVLLILIIAEPALPSIALLTANVVNDPCHAKSKTTAFIFEALTVSTFTGWLLECSTEYSTSVRTSYCFVETATIFQVWLHMIWRCMCSGNAWPCGCANCQLWLSKGEGCSLDISAYVKQCKDSGSKAWSVRRNCHGMFTARSQYSEIRLGQLKFIGCERGQATICSLLISLKRASHLSTHSKSDSFYLDIKFP